MNGADVEVVFVQLAGIFRNWVG